MPDTTLTIRANSAIGTISPRLYGHFAEHLGRCCYKGLWVGNQRTSVPQQSGFRSDVLGALRALPVPMLRFHAKWHRDAFLPEVQKTGREIDWPLLLATGQSRFCGLHLHVWNRWADPTNEATTWWYGRWKEKSIDWWWGEGDEKFFVDGEKFPSTFGAGSEDYIGYAWAAEPPFPTFESAFASQPYIELNANGHTSVNRFQICDNVPFSESFEASIEKYKPNRWGEGNLCLYATVVYWYQRAGEIDRYGPTPLAERVGYYSDAS